LIDGVQLITVTLNPVFLLNLASDLISFTIPRIGLNHLLLYSMPQPNSISRFIFHRTVYFKELLKIICYLIIRCLFYKSFYKPSSGEWFYICQLHDKIDFFFHKTYMLIKELTKNNFLAYPLKI